MQHDRSIPLVDQLASAATRSADPTTRELFARVQALVDDRVEEFFVDPSSERLQVLVGLWTRAVKLLKDTPEPAQPVETAAESM